MSHQLTRDVLNSLLGAVHHDNLQQNVVVVNLSDRFTVNWVGITCQLVNVRIQVRFNLTQEVLSLVSGANFLGFIKARGFTALLELAENYLLIGLSQHKLLFLLGLERSLRVDTQKFSENCFTLLGKHLLD